MFPEWANTKAAELLAARGLRATPQRRAVLAHLLHQRTPQSLQDLHLALAERGFVIDKTSLCRLMQQLTEKQVLAKHFFDASTPRYEAESGAEEHKHRVACVSCSATAEVALEHTETEELKRLEAQSGFRITGHRFEFFGECGNCQH